MPIKEYKTFDNTTGEIKIHCRYDIGSNGHYEIYQNEILLFKSYSRVDAEDYFNKLLQMDYYIASKVESYEVYIIL